MEWLTVPEFSSEIKKSKSFTRAGIRLNLIPYIRKGKVILIHKREVARYKKNPFKITRKMLGR